MQSTVSLRTQVWYLCFLKNARVIGAFRYLPKETIPLLVMAMVLSMSTASLRASHISGVNVSYQCLGGGSYELAVRLFRDCEDQNPLPSTLNVYIGSSCIDLGYKVLTQVSVTDVSQLCAAELPNSTCNGGFQSGVQVGLYTITIDLEACIDWKIIVSEQNRDEQIINLVDPSLYSIHSEAFLDNSDGSCNTSPQLGLVNLPYVCANSTIYYNLQFTEPDGDSLAYALVPALTSIVPVAPEELVYNPGYSGSSPIPGMTIDPISGQIEFLPTAQGKFNAVVAVYEYRDGELIGTVYYDFMFLVYVCPVPPPQPDTATFSQVSGGGYPLNENTIGICAEDSFCFELAFTSADPSISVALSSDIAAHIPGATETVTGSNPAIIRFCGQLPPGYEQGSFIISAIDDACPLYGQTYYSIFLNLRQPLVVSADQVVCRGQPVQLEAYHDTAYTWYGEQGILLSGADISCNPCAAPVVTADTSTYYIVEGLYANSSCSNRDTVFVDVPLALAVELSDETCYANDGEVSIDVLTGSGDYDVIWFDVGAAPLSRTDLVGGDYQVLIIDNEHGCNRIDEYSIGNLDFPIADAGFDSIWCGLDAMVSAAPSFGFGQWTAVGDVLISNELSPASSVFVQNEGLYPLVWTEDAGDGCIARDTVIIGFRYQPEMQNPTWECTGSDALFRVHFDLANGDTANYQVEGAVGAIVDLSFTSADIPSETPLEFILTDGGFCGSDTLAGSHFCPVITSAGLLSPDTLHICGANLASPIILEPAARDGNDTLIYALHTESLATELTILQSSDQADFQFSSDLQLDQLYFITAITGNGTPTGVDFNDPFLDFSPSVPIIFHALPVASMEGAFSACPYDSLLLPLDFGGAFPQVLNYQFNGAVSQTVIESANTEIFISDSGTYALTGTSTAFCEGMAQGQIAFSHFPLPEATLSGPGFICNGDTAELFISLTGSGETSFVVARIKATLRILVQQWHFLPFSRPKRGLIR